MNYNARHPSTDKTAMRLSLFNKIFLSLLVTSLLTLIAISLLISISFRGGLQNYLNSKELEKAQIVATHVATLYQQHNSWEPIKSNQKYWQDLMELIGEKAPPFVTEQARPSVKMDHVLSPVSARLTLLDQNDQYIAGIYQYLGVQASSVRTAVVPILLGSRQVGSLEILQRKKIDGPLAESFFSQQMRSFYIISIGAALLTFALASLLVRYFLKPMNALQKGAHELMVGNLEYQIQPLGDDELADLSHAFNQMTATLKQQKETRDQWLSDISHELRTPISVLRSEIEAIEDGIRQPEPKYIRSLHDQVLNLSTLVEDLYQLSLTDSATNIDPSEEVNLAALIEAITGQNQLRLAQKPIQLTISYEQSQNYRLQADSKSLQQLFSNLFENSLRYTDADGQIKITLSESKNQLTVVFEDSAPSVPTDSLPKLFDRLYRVDKSRSRRSGGSGLGLSICKNIIDAHNGHIDASKSALGGLKLTIHLPKEHH